MSTRRVAAVLFVAAAALLVVGAAVETASGHHDESARRAVASREGPTGVEGTPAHEAVEHAATAPNSTDEDGDDERVLGIDVESAAIVGTAFALSVALAVGLWVTARRWVGALAVVVATAFAIFDVAELIHQLTHLRLGIAVIAAIVAVGHFAAGGLAAGRQRAVAS